MTGADDLSIITLGNIMAGGIYNDIGFQLKDRIIFLIEAQSTWTENILVRVLMYLAKSYQDYIIRTGQNIYGSRKVQLPQPELYVIYTGSRKARPRFLSFAESFFPGGDCCLDIRVNMIYDGKDGDIISQYVAFTKIFDSQVRKYGLTAEAVREAIRICKDRNVLRQFLQGRESEVVDIMITLFSQEEVWDMQLRNERREAAVITTIEDGKYYGASRRDTLLRVMEKFSIPKEDADRLMTEYW